MWRDRACPRGDISFFSYEADTVVKCDRPGTHNTFISHSQLPQCILQYTLRSSFFNLVFCRLASNTVDGVISVRMEIRYSVAWDGGVSFMVGFTSACRWSLMPCG